MSKLYLDMDGVFVDFEGGLVDVTGKPYDQDNPAQMWKQISEVPQFYRTLKMLPEARVLFNYIVKRYPDAEMLTSAPRPEGFLNTAPEDKLWWMREYLSKTVKVNVVHHWKEKAKFVVPGAVLLDDMARNVKHWEEAGGIGILHLSAKNTMCIL